MTRRQAVRCVVGTTMIWIGLILLTAWILAGSKHSAKDTGRLVYDFYNKQERPKMCHSCYFIIEGDGVMKKVGMTEIANLMKEWDREER